MPVPDARLALSVSGFQAFVQSEHHRASSGTGPSSPRRPRLLLVTGTGRTRQQRPAIQVSVGGIVYREAAAKQERIQLQEQHERVPREGGEGVSGQDGTGKEEEGGRGVFACERVDPLPTKSHISQLNPNLNGIQTTLDSVGGEFTNQHQTQRTHTPLPGFSSIFRIDNFY